MKYTILSAIAVLLIPTVASATPRDQHKKQAVKRPPVRQQEAPKSKAGFQKSVQAEVAELHKSVRELQHLLGGKINTLTTLQQKLKGCDEAKAAMAKKITTLERARAESSANAKRSGVEKTAALLALSEVKKAHAADRAALEKAAANAAAGAKANAEMIAKLKEENAAMKRNCHEALAGIIGLRKQIDALNGELAPKPAQPAKADK